MSGIQVLNKWLAPPLVALLVAGGTLSAASASQSSAPPAAPSCQKERKSPAERPVPPGQLTRRGVVGDVADVITAEDGTIISIIVETQFGNVEIAVPEGFEGSVEVGSRIATLLDKEPKPVVVTPPGTQTDTPITIETPEASTDTPFRSGSALRITVIPTKATRSHDRGVVQSQDGDTLEVIDEDGNVDQLDVTGDGGVQVLPEDGQTTEPTDGAEGATGTDATTGTDETTGTEQGEGEEAPTLDVEVEQVGDGTDAVLLIQCTSLDATPQVRSIQRADRVTERLERLEAKALDRDEARAAKIADLQEKRQERQQARLERTTSNAPPDNQGSVNKALRKARGQCPEDGDTDPECPTDRGKSADKGSGQGGGGQGGGNQGGGNQGGGNQGGGNQGGGNQGGGKGKDKG